MNTKSKYTHRFIARIVMEAVTPLAVSNGEKSILTDALVATDVNGLPFIRAPLWQVSYVMPSTTMRELP
jgi:hypothetical protein